MASEIDRHRVQELRSGGATLVEVLGADYFADAHLPGALNMPLDLVDEIAPQLVPAPSAPVVLYSGGPSCTIATMAAERLERLGYGRVFVYRGGKQDWIEEGLPIERGD